MVSIIRSSVGNKQAQIYIYILGDQAGSGRDCWQARFFFDTHKVYNLCF